MEVCEVEDEGLVLWRALDVALIVDLCAAPAPVRRKHRSSCLVLSVEVVIVIWRSEAEIAKVCCGGEANIRENRDYFNPNGVEMSCREK
jgi:hypothetical protein